MIEILGIDIGQQDLLIGFVTGLTYAAFAAGFLLVYRATGTLNFAQGEMGAFSLALFVLLHVRYDVNWWFAFLLAVAAGAAIGTVTELVVIRRLFESPRLVILIATIGVGTILAGAKIYLPQVRTAGPVPLPFSVEWEPTQHLRILEREVVVLVIIPVLIIALGLFLTRTRFGLAVRASAANPDTARVFGISVKRTSTIVWTIAGAFAASTAILLAPLQNINAAQAGTVALGPPLLLRALVVSLLARMRSLPRALAFGVVVGVVEKIVRSNVESTNQNIVNLYLFLAVLGVILFGGVGRSEQANWSLSPKVKPIPTRLRQVWWVRHSSLIGFAVIFGFLLLLPLFTDTSSTLFLWTGIMVFAMITYSLTILTGWAGQLSLGQFAFVGLGGLTMTALTSGHDIPIPFNAFDWSLELPWLPGVLVATAVGILAALVIGLPALRVKGLLLAVTTLAFAVAASTWLFNQDFFTGGSSAPRPPRPPAVDWGPVDIDFGESRRAFYWLVLVLLVLVVVLVGRIRRTGVGRTMIAVRENEEMAAASTVSPARVKLTAFAVSGGIAAFGGALFVTLQPSIQPGTMFAPEASLDVVIVSIIGGLGSLAGPILGALWVRGINAVWSSDLVRLITSDIGLLILLMYFPGGLIQLVYMVRDAMFGWLDRRLEAREAAAPVPALDRTVPSRPASREVVVPNGAAALQADQVSVRFGGNLAVSDVSIEVAPNELVGLIGTNGAGKSTLLNAISGFVPSTGTVSVLGRDVTGTSAAARHRLGLGRGFQAARLYPDLTVRESLMVALEARERSLLVPSMTGLPPSPGSERRKRAEADELMDYLGLGRYADNFIDTLSTGTRRIVELGSLLAVDAKVLLLDEPTGGVAQRETEAFGPLIKRIQRELDAAVVVIEHDMPLVMSISDRVYCLEAGSVIAHGSPDEVRHDPQVVASYLGTDERAIQRSDATR